MHVSAAHAAANWLAFGVLFGLAYTYGHQQGLLRRFGLGCLLVWPLSTLSLIFCPQVTSYVGASGAVHGAAALLGTLLVTARARSVLGWALLLGLAYKLWQEQAWVIPVVWSPDWGFNVVQVAHLYGAAVGGVVGLLMGPLMRLLECVLPVPWSSSRPQN